MASTQEIKTPETVNYVEGVTLENIPGITELCHSDCGFYIPINCTKDESFNHFLRFHSSSDLCFLCPYNCGLKLETPRTLDDTVKHMQITMLITNLFILETL